MEEQAGQVVEYLAHYPGELVLAERHGDERREADGRTAPRVKPS